MTWKRAYLSLAAAAALAILIAACAPAAPAVEGRYKAVAVGDFAETETPPDLGFALGQKLAGYLEIELRREFKGSVSRLPLPAASGAKEPVGGGPVGTLVISGSVGLREQPQKALRETDIPEDGPFRLENRGLAERKRFMMSIECRFVDAATGEAVWENRFQEIRTYREIATSPEFALPDLLAAVKARLFAALFGAPAAGGRPLLTR